MTTVKLFMLVIILAAAQLATLAAAQSVEPVWLSPTSVGTYPETFPELGVWSNISVGAGARFLRPVVVMDSKKTLWILHGRSININPGFNVWNYDPKTDLYRWVAGPGNSTTNPRNAGALRVPSPDNHPGLVSSTPGTIDHNDNIWFMSVGAYGGELWMFNTTSHYFTRMKGDNLNSTVEYGTLGQPGDNVSPGKIFEGCLVVDSLNNLWQIAGATRGESMPTNRIWHFNTTSFQWTFIGGNSSSNVDTRFDGDTLYGTREGQACDIDDDNRVWLFGGAEQSFFNDVWSYDTRALQWQLESGSNESVGANATVATMNAFDADNHPAAKSFSTFVDRKDGTLLLISGFSLSVGSTNDIWLFNKTLKQWKLIYGDPFNLNLTGNFSNYRTPGSVMPAGRNWHGSARGLNIDGDVFMYGGAPNTSLIFNDIWLIPQSQCNVSTLNKCSPNARCVEAMIGYSCECNEDFVGDGFNCQASPSTPVVSRGVIVDSLFTVLSLVAFVLIC